MADITLYEGTKELNVGLTPILLPVANLYGKVTDAGTGYPAGGVKVSIDDLVTYTDASGNYGFAGLTPGSYIITFEKDSYVTETSDIVLVEGNNELNVELGASIKVKSLLWWNGLRGAGLGNFILDWYKGYIGFRVENEESVDINGVYVKYIMENGGIEELANPLDQVSRTGFVPLPQPFTFPASSKKYIWYHWNPAYIYYKATAEVWVDNQLVDTKSVEFDIE